MISVENDIEFHFPIRTLDASRRADPGEASNVLVCHCNAVNDRTIRQVVKSCARTCRQVDRACAAGSTCGGCQPVIREIIAAEREAETISAGELGVAAS